ncbi:MAG: M15 family metallopeptidase [Saprospiraceae bacterium]|nr:M15 family metallopeptidase [Saprospiraceae bacterium]
MLTNIIALILCSYFLPLTPSDSDFVNLMSLDPTIKLDIKYATDDNFVKEKMYQCEACYLRKDVAKSIITIQKHLQKKGLGLKIFDCYRPLDVQKKLWQKMPDPRFVMNPSKGSEHNKGGAVDLTIIDSKGQELDMGTKYDFFGPEAYHTYRKLPKQVLENRLLLTETMKRFGFREIRTEWWHYSYKKKNYPISNWNWSCK